MRAIWLYRLAVIYAVLFGLASLGTSILGVLSNASWKDMDGQGKFMAVVSIALNLVNAMIAFVSKEAKKLADGSNPIPDNGTDIFKPPQVAPPPKPS